MHHGHIVEAWAVLKKRVAVYMTKFDVLELRYLMEKRKAFFCVVLLGWCQENSRKFLPGDAYHRKRFPFFHQIAQF